MFQFLISLLPLCHGNTEPEGLPTEHRTLALLNGLLLLTLLPKLDKAVPSASQTAVRPPLGNTTHSILGI